MQKVKKINESRHSKLNKSPKIKDKSKPITDSPIKAYMNKILPKIIMMALFVIVLIFSDDIGNAITSALVSASASTNTPEVTPKEILPIHTVINIVAMIFVLASTLGLTLDLMYIAFPFLRDMMDRNKSADSTSFVSDIANQTGFLAGLYKFSIATSTSNVGIGYSIANALVYLLLIIGFTFFYTYATFNPAEVSNNIKKNGGFIPGIRAGKPTTEYLSSIISKLTWFGGLFLAIIAILPMLLRFTNLNIAFGGTSILIVVGVALETVQQLESQLAMRHYKGFLE